MNEKAIATYRMLMNEIMHRIEAIDLATEDKTSLRPRIAEELCWLQLRMICELIAIGCLIVHGTMRRNLLSTYKADHIIDKMSQLQPMFFPVPIETEDAVDDDGKRRFVKKKSGFLTQSELATLRGKKAGPHLHRRNARDITKDSKPIDFREIVRWRDKITQLLNRHQIVTPNLEYICVVSMQGPSGDVTSSLFQKIDPSPSRTD